MDAGGEVGSDLDERDAGGTRVGASHDQPALEQLDERSRRGDDRKGRAEHVRQAVVVQHAAVAGRRELGEPRHRDERPVVDVDDELAWLVFPAASMAVQVTVVSPIANALPDAELQETPAPGWLSEAVAAKTTLPKWLPGALTAVTEAGTVAVGAVRSIVNASALEKSDVAPATSTPRTVIACAPSLRAAAVKVQWPEALPCVEPRRIRPS